MEKIKDKARFVWSIIYFALAVVIWFFYRNQIFYLGPKETYNFFRFIWCIVCSCFGFSALAFNLALKEGLSTTMPKYIIYYPIMLIVISCVSFSIFNIFKATSGYIFYYASFAFSFILASHVDYLWDIFKNFSKKG